MDSSFYIIESHPAPRGLERFHFAKASGLILRQDSEFETTGGRVVATALYENYREVPEGVRLPHVIRITARPADGSDMTLTLKVKSAKHNVPLDDARFRKPAA